MTLHKLILLALLSLTSAAAVAEEVTFTVEDADTTVTREPYCLQKECITADFSGGSVYSDHLRLFKNQTLTVSTSEGYVTGVEFTCTEAGAMDGGPAHAVADVGSYQWSEATGQWSGKARALTILADGYQLRFVKIVVTYQPYEIVGVDVSEQATDGDSFYCTAYFSDTNIMVPDGVEGRTYCVDGGALTVSHTYQPGDVVPAGTGVVLKTQEAGRLQIVTTAMEGFADSNNMLSGTDIDSVVNDPDYRYYMLTLNNGAPKTVGFYWSRTSANGQSVRNHAHKAFLAVPVDNGAADVRGFSLAGEVFSGIEAADGALPTLSDAAVFDLSGRRVECSQPAVSGRTSGICIIGRRKVLLRGLSLK